MSAIPLAFYAPLKSPRHAVPSGDRAMARALMKALERAGFAPELACELRTLDPDGDPAAQERLRRHAVAEADRFVALYRRRPASSRPRAWFSYHVYYKAPDWIGPRVADALAIPYLVAEGSRAGKRASGPYALAHAGAEAALDRADVVFALSALDRVALAKARLDHQSIVDFPPFLDHSGWPLPDAAGCRLRSGPDGAARLLAVAMMRTGDKLQSYRLLAEALGRIAAEPWSLDVVGDGEARGDVMALFAPFGDRVRLLGAVSDRARLASLYRGADILVWPAVNEAYGMALLEAQAFGCPVVAGGYGGVPGVVRDRETGIVTPPGDAAAFAQAVAMLVANPALRRALGADAARFVRDERSIDGAAARLRTALLACLPEADRCAS